MRKSKLLARTALGKPGARYDWAQLANVYSPEAHNKSTCPLCARDWNVSRQLELRSPVDRTIQQREVFEGHDRELAELKADNGTD
jgi:hypothetical protein